MLIKHLSRLVGQQISNHQYAQFFCKYCLHCCSTGEILAKHMERCQLHGAKRVKMPDPKENKLFFKKKECKLRLPFVIYADFESILLKNNAAEQKPNQPWTLKLDTHQACNFGFHTVSTDKRFYSKPKLHFGEDSERHSWMPFSVRLLK